jgi:hypothetical protein
VYGDAAPPHRRRLGRRVMGALIAHASPPQRSVPRLGILVSLPPIALI